MDEIVSEMQLLQFPYFVGISKCEEYSWQLEEWLTENKLNETYEKSSDSEKRLIEEKAGRFYIDGLKTVLEKHSINLGINDMKEVNITDHDDQGFVFLAEASLAACDHIFRAISEKSYITVYEFTTVCSQAYDSGEYDSGSFMHGSEHYSESCIKLKEKLIQAGMFPKFNLDVQNVPVWRILGDCILRHENGHSVYDGINVVFGNFAMKDDDGEESEDISYKVFDIGVDTPKGRSITFYGGLKSCTDLAQVDWSYIRENYEEIRDTDDGGDIGPSTADFENSVRQKFSEFRE